MKDDTPIACSLGPADLEQRLAASGEIGAASLISRSCEGGRHLLRFRADPTTRRRLEEIVAAEAQCCSFLDLRLTADDDELTLSIAAPEGAQALADELAASFGADTNANGKEQKAKRIGRLVGGGGLAVAACCIGLPVLFGVAIGATIGSILDIGAAVLVAAGVGVLLHRRRTSRCKRC